MFNMETFSVPFRFANGLAVKHAEGSDQYYLHLLSMVLQTQPGEMPLDFNFGTNDPVFERVNRATILEISAKYVPELNIQQIATVLDNDGVERIVLKYRIETLV
jgi:hypothetical protein